FSCFRLLQHAVHERIVGPWNHVRRNQLAHHLGRCRARIHRGAHAAYIAAHDRRHVSPADLHGFHQFHTGGFHHGVAGLNQSDEALGFNQSDCLTHCISFLPIGCQLSAASYAFFAAAFLFCWANEGSSSCGREITCTLTTSPMRAAASAPASVAAFTAATSPSTNAVTRPEPTLCQPVKLTFADLSMA